MFCALSGTVPKDPVLSTKSNHVFEKSVLLKYLKETGKDPINQELLSEDDLISIKSSEFLCAHIKDSVVVPKTPSATSIPSLLVSLQNEWDAAMLEVFTIKQQYQSMRQELSNALYENDAAKRVIARLVQERDQARQALEDLKLAPGTVVSQKEETNGHEMEVDQVEEGGLPAQVIQALDARSAALSATRRKRKPAPSVATVADLEAFTETKTVASLHSASGGGGIFAMDLLNATLAGSQVDWALTGGKDGHALIVDWKNDGKLVTDVKAHSKKINTLLWRASVTTENVDQASFLTGSADKTIKYWALNGSEEDGYKAASQYTFKGHSGEVTGLSLHATGDYFGSCSADSTWILGDIESGSEIVKVAHPEVKGYSCIDFHPDGLLLGAGTMDGVVRIWDVKSRSNVQNFTGFEGKLTSISFSENGYYLATASESRQVKLWDLRKLTNFYTIELPEDVSTVHRVRFDYSAQYLGVAHGNNLSVFLNKQWNEIVKLSQHSGVVTDFRFGRDAQTIVSSGMDRKVLVCGKQ